MSWNDLSMRDRAAFIKVGVKNGLYSIQDIQKAYNKFAEGGFLNEEDDEEYYKLHPELRGRLRTPKSTLKKMKLWNGTSWTNLDGTALA